MSDRIQAKLYDSGRWIGNVFVEPGQEELEVFDVVVFRPSPLPPAAPVFEYDGHRKRYLLRREKPVRAPARTG